MFTLENKHVFIYGYNDGFDRMNNIVSHISDAGSTFECVIDRDKSHVCEYQIITIEEFENDNLYSHEDVIFFLNFWDSNTHMIVANELYNKGFSKILFIPIGTELSLRESRKMRHAFNAVLYGGIAGDYGIPSYDEIMKVDRTICDYGDYISFWMDVDLLYSDARSEEGINAKYSVDKYYNCPVKELDYYFELYDYLYNEGEYPDRYLENSIKGRDAKLFLENRKRTFDEHKIQIKYDPCSIENAPILIIWDDNDENFKIKDGYHRTISFIEQGYERVPVICSKQDFQKYNDLIHL